MTVRRSGVMIGSVLFPSLLVIRFSPATRPDVPTSPSKTSYLVPIWWDQIIVLALSGVADLGSVKLLPPPPLVSTTASAAATAIAAAAAMPMIQGVRRRRRWSGAAGTGVSSGAVPGGAPPARPPTPLGSRVG